MQGKWPNCCAIALTLCKIFLLFRVLDYLILSTLSTVTSYKFTCMLLDINITSSIFFIYFEFSHHTNTNLFIMGFQADNTSTLISPMFDSLHQCPTPPLFASQPTVCFSERDFLLIHFFEFFALWFSLLFLTSFIHNTCPLFYTSFSSQLKASVHHSLLFISCPVPKPPQVECFILNMFFLSIVFQYLFLHHYISSYHAYEKDHSAWVSFPLSHFSLHDNMQVFPLSSKLHDFITLMVKEYITVNMSIVLLSSHLFLNNWVGYRLGLLWIVLQGT